MKNLVLGLIAILLVVSSNVHSQNPHFTRDYPGIPVISQNGDWWHLINNDLVPYDSMKSMGVRYFWNNVTNKVPQMELVANKGFKIIPVNITEDTSVYNWIGYYCDAKYTEWEAEGTDTINIGKATLERDLQKTTPSPNGNYISTVPYAPASTILWGPYYYQEKNYMVRRDTSDNGYVIYNAKFLLKLERNSYYPPYDTTSDNPTDQICKLLITQSRVNTSTTPWYIDSVITIDSVVLHRSDFPVLNQFGEQLRTYKLTNGFPVSNKINIPRNSSSDIPPDSMGRFLRENIEFKVVWLGNPKYLLSVDKVIVYDERGAELKNPLGSSTSAISAQIDQLLSYDNTVVGWHGIDEPFSIDNFEPIKIVAQTVRNKNKQLYLPFMGFWDGVWESINNPFGTNHLSPHKEFFMRTNRLVNIWQNSYMYDQPFKDTSYIDPVKFGTTGYKDINIRITANNYSLARSIDSLYGVSLQTSAQKNVQSDIRDPKPWEILYNANLALMYGAKYLQ